MPHTNCGMELFTDDVIAGVLEMSLQTATFAAEPGWKNTEADGGSIHGRFVKRHAFSNIEKSVADGVQRTRSRPATSPRTASFKVRTGHLGEVAEASAVRRPTARRVSLTSRFIDESSPANLEGVLETVQALSWRRMSATSK